MFASRRLAPSALLVALFAALTALTPLACGNLTEPPVSEVPADPATTPAAPTTWPSPTGAPPSAPATLTPLPAASAAPADTAAPTFTPLAPPADLPFTLDQADDAQAALRPEFAADVARLPDAARYVIDVAVTFNPDGSATLLGRELIRYTNRETFALNELYLMLWPNEPSQCLGRARLIGPVTVGGQAVAPEMQFDGLAARLPLAAPLAPGASVDLEAAFETQADPGLEHGARFGLNHDLLVAPTFYPLIPRLVHGQWQIEPPSSLGDITNSDTAFYAWRVTVPADLQVAASGVVVSETQASGLRSQLILTGPMRDLALIVGHLAVASRTVDGVRLNAFLPNEHFAVAQTVLDQAGGQVETLQAEVGPYPFVELDIVDVSSPLGGIEYPGLVYLGGLRPDHYFQEDLVHEVGHQWFYSLIGDDQSLEPWLDEGAAAYTQLLYNERVINPQVKGYMLDSLWMFLGNAPDPTLPIGGSVDSYGTAYGTIVYQKGALFFEALRRELGDETFFAFLHAYYDRYVYGFATTAGFQEVAETTCACDLDDLFRLWVSDGGPVAQPIESS